MYTVLCVCTGNICRSPAAELLLGATLDGSVRVVSAGTRGLPAWPVSPPMAALLAADGIDPSGFESRTLTAADVRDANLVLTLTAAHRSQVLELEPLALRRTLALGELARLSAAVPPGTVTGDDHATRLTALVRVAVAQRHRFVGAHPEDDVIDPYQLGDDVYATSYAQLKGHIDLITAALRQNS